MQTDFITISMTKAMSLIGRKHTGGDQQQKLVGLFKKKKSLHYLDKSRKINKLLNNKTRFI